MRVLYVIYVFVSFFALGTAIRCIENGLEDEQQKEKRSMKKNIVTEIEGERESCGGKGIKGRIIVIWLYMDVI